MNWPRYRWAISIPTVLLSVIPSGSHFPLPLASQ